MHARRLVRIATGMHVRRWGEIALICIRHSQKPRVSIILILLLTSAGGQFWNEYHLPRGLEFSLELRHVRGFLLLESTWRIAAWFKALYSLIGFLVPPEIRAWFFALCQSASLFRLLIMTGRSVCKFVFYSRLFFYFFLFSFSSLFLSAPGPS